MGHAHTRVQVAARDGGAAPSEVSVQVQDLAELVGKLRSHMYKLEKKSTGSDAALALLGTRVDELLARTSGHARVSKRRHVMRTPCRLCAPA